MRAQGIDILLTIHLEPTTSSSEPLVLLANDLENGGPAKSRSVVAPAGLMNAIHSGDFRRVFAMAATAAFNDQSLRISGLGGRGNAFTVEDFSGFTGQTFVFKPSTMRAADRDESRAIALREHISYTGLDELFGVIEHLDKLDVNDSTVSVRRFARGRTLRQAMHEASASEKISMIRRTARFLGVIHSFEGSGGGNTNSCRKVLKEREVGRWIRRVAGPQYLGLFDQWWNLYGGLRSFPRRDAHSLNWLVAEDGRILAVDLEAQGERPLTYELAQLVEDDPLFGADDTKLRLEILEEYADAINVSSESLRGAFEASIAARAVGLLSDPRSSEPTRNHGYELLEQSRRTASSDSLRVWVTELLAAWKLRTGLADPSRYRAIQPSDRIRISKAMSYHLRHDASAPTARGGWMYADDLATVMRAHGHRVTAEQLLVVAGALGEPRFELDGTEIRAAYGHSLARRSDFEAASPPESLFHATPSRHLQHIVEGRAGLESGGRQFVHLTPDPERALRSAERHGADALLLKVDAARVEGLVKATEDTWLAPRVKVEQLAIVPVHEVA
ncbi:RNA 2'-phosphotransferase [Microbacterium sp. NPDC016588]